MKCEENNVPTMLMLVVRKMVVTAVSEIVLPLSQQVKAVRSEYWTIDV